MRLLRILFLGLFAPFVFFLICLTMAINNFGGRDET
jgi:hypothetical protein